MEFGEDGDMDFSNPLVTGKERWRVPTRKGRSLETVGTKKNTGKGENKEEEKNAKASEKR